MNLKAHFDSVLEDALCIKLLKNKGQTMTIELRAAHLDSIMGKGLDQTKAPLHVARLLKWVDSHCTPAPTLYHPEDDTMTIYSIGMDRDGSELYFANIGPASVQFARNVLGY